MPLFDRYLFADYSGGSENNRAQRGIRLYQSIGNADPQRLFHTVPNNQGNPQNFNRNELRERVVAVLADATEAGDRVIFGFDHQYSWPTHLRQFAGIGHLDWRDALLVLDDGNPVTGLPALDIPRRYCSAFNQFCGNDVFWSPLNYIAAHYQVAGIPLENPEAERFRLTELAPPLQGASRPKPADAVGGRGEGIVGGQTICGLHQIRLMLDNVTIMWWPFDGMSINDDAFEGMHVGIEIYPSALRPANVPQDDDNDAIHSCLYVRDADHAGQLAGLMTLTPQAQCAEQIRREGWIVGMNPAQIEVATTLQAVMQQLTEHERRIRELEQRLNELGGE